MHVETEMKVRVLMGEVGILVVRKRGELSELLWLLLPNQDPEHHTWMSAHTWLFEIIVLYNNQPGVKLTVQWFSCATHPFE